MKKGLCRIPEFSSKATHLDHASRSIAWLVDGLAHATVALNGRHLPPLAIISIFRCLEHRNDCQVFVEDQTRQLTPAYQIVFNQVPLKWYQRVRNHKQRWQVKLTGDTLTDGQREEFFKILKDRDAGCLLVTI